MSPDVIWAAAGHDGGFTLVAISPDGEIVATAGGQRSPPFGSASDLKIRRALDGRLLHTLPTSSTGIESIEFSRDGALLPSLESLVIPNGPFELYFVARRTGDWSVAYRVKAHSVGPENVSGVASLSRDSTTLASASAGLGELKLWKLVDGSPIRTLPRLPRPRASRPPTSTTEARSTSRMRSTSSTTSSSAGRLRPLRGAAMIRAGWIRTSRDLPETSGAVPSPHAPPRTVEGFRPRWLRLRSLGVAGVPGP